jgi:hypothetical protein
VTFITSAGGADTRRENSHWVMGTTVGILFFAMAIVACGSPPQARLGGTPTASTSPDQALSLGASPSASATAVSDPAVTPSPTPITCAGGVSSPTPVTGTQPSPPTIPTSSVSYGAIAGHLSFPSEVFPSQFVYAINTSGPSKGAYSTETAWNQSTYTIKGISPGAYYVYSATRPLRCAENGTLTGALYSDAVKCGLDVSCTSHKPLAVVVRSGATTAAIDVTDWYSPDPTIPVPPSWIVPADAQHAPPAVAYPSPRDAAESISGELLVDDMIKCPVNRACTAVGGEHDGTQAAYFVGFSGSNTDLIDCGTWVFQDRAGWHGLIQTCRPGPVFPAVGQSGAISLSFGLPPSSCANVRSVPGAKGSVVACLTAGTQVSLDSGPTYLPMATTDGLWWHIAARGWIADDFLRFHPGP